MHTMKYQNYDQQSSPAPHVNSGRVRNVRTAWEEQDGTFESVKTTATEMREEEHASSEESLMQAIHAMQNKYSRNIRVIEQLFQEKEEMADKVKYLEEQLRHAQRFGKDVSVEGPVCDFDFDIEAHDYDWNGTSALPSSSSTKEYARGLVSAAEAANMFPESNDIDINGAVDGGGTRNKKEKKRMGREGTRTYGLSPQLQADSDRYLQKIKYVQDKEKLEKLEQEKYELQLEKRRLRASKAGSEFTNMRQREERARELKRIRDARKLNKEVELEAAGLAESHKVMTMNANLRNSVKNSKNWSDIQKEEEILRRDRIERRKQHLATSAAYPSNSIMSSVDKWKTKDVKCNDKNQNNAVEKAYTPSPAEISAQLKRRQERWERHLTKEKEILNSKRKTTIPVQSVIGMESRQKMYDERRRQKKLDRERQELEDRRSKAAADKIKTERIMRCKVPESSRRLTKASEERAKSVRDSFENMRKKDEENKKKEMRKMRRSREISSFLSTLVGGKDFANAETERMEHAKQKAAESANAYKLSRKRNQERIKASLSDRPSLIERHDMAIASSHAATSALRKVAKVVGPGTCDDDGGTSLEGTAKWKNEFDSEELFDEDEKIQLGIRDI